MTLQEISWQQRSPDLDGDCSEPVMPWKDYQHSNILKPAPNRSKRPTGFSALYWRALVITALAVAALLMFS